MFTIHFPREFPMIYVRTWAERQCGCSPLQPAQIPSFAYIQYNNDNEISRYRSTLRTKIPGIWYVYDARMHDNGRGYSIGKLWIREMWSSSYTCAYMVIGRIILLYAHQSCFWGGTGVLICNWVGWIIPLYPSSICVWNNTRRSQTIMNCDTKNDPARTNCTHW